MADNNSWVPLVQILERLFPNLTPQIVPAAHNAKAVREKFCYHSKGVQIDVYELGSVYENSLTTRLTVDHLFRSGL